MSETVPTKDDLTNNGKICYYRFVPHVVMEACLPITEQATMDTQMIHKRSTENVVRIINLADIPVLCQFSLRCDTPNLEDQGKVKKIVLLQLAPDNDNTKVRADACVNVIISVTILH